MTESDVVSLINEGIQVLLITSLPLVGIGLLVGFIISLVQAVTQIQEQTLTFVPKMVVVMLMLAFSAPWLISVFVDFTTQIWDKIPYYAR